MLQVRRYFDDERARADMVYDELEKLPETCVIVDPHDPSRQRKHGPDYRFEDLLVPVFRAGKKTYSSPSLDEIRQRTQSQIADFHSAILRLDNPHNYPVGLEASLHQNKAKLVLELRGN